MNKMDLFARDHLVLFSLSVSFVFILMLVASAMLGALWSGEGAYGQPGGILGRAIFIAVLLVTLARLGWLRPAGFASSGGWRTWLSLLLPLVYSIAASAYAMTGDFAVHLSGSSLPGQAALFILTAASMEEVVFRGIILHALVRAWGSTQPGLVRSVLVSSLFFSSIHLFDFLGGRPLPNVLLQSLQAFFLGVYLGAQVLKGNSIYPAVFFHAIVNLAGYLVFAGQNLEPAPAVWLLLSLLMLPLALYGIVQLRGMPRHTALPAAMKWG